MKAHVPSSADETKSMTPTQALAEVRGNATLRHRVEPSDSQDYFPTPPWATRALCEIALGNLSALHQMSAWECAAGAGHMSRVLEAYFAVVHASDIADRGGGFRFADFLDEHTALDPHPNWIITNPPYNLAKHFIQRARLIACSGVAMLLPIQALEGIDRYTSIYQPDPPSVIWVFSERLNLFKGQLDPRGSKAQTFAWFVWHGTPDPSRKPQLGWIPRGSRTRFERIDDYSPQDWALSDARHSNRGANNSATQRQPSI